MLFELYSARKGDDAEFGGLMAVTNSPKVAQDWEDQGGRTRLRDTFEKELA